MSALSIVWPERTIEPEPTSSRLDFRLRSAITLAVCAFVLAGCAEESHDESIRLPDFRMVTTEGGDEALLLGATPSIEEDRNELPTLMNVSRELYVKSDVDMNGEMECERLGAAESSATTEQGALAGSFELTEPSRPALRYLGDVATGEDIFLFVLWTVEGGGDVPLLLLDAAEYSFEKAEVPDETPADTIILEAKASAENVVTPRRVDEPFECPPSGMGMDMDDAPVEVVTLSRDPDRDGLDSLVELNAGLGVSGATQRSIPFANLPADDGTPPEVPPGNIIVSENDDELTGVLSPTWRVIRDGGESGAVTGGERLVLEPRGNSGADDISLDLNIIALVDDRLLLEVVFPAQFAGAEGFMDPLIMYGESLDSNFMCLNEPADLSMTPSLPELPATAMSGLFSEPGGTGRLVLRCESLGFGRPAEIDEESGVSSAVREEDNTVVLSVGLNVTRQLPPVSDGGSAPPPKIMSSWSLRGDRVRVLVYRPPLQTENPG